MNAWLQDSIGEIKKLPTAGKVGLGAVVLLVVGVALYERNLANTSASTSTSGLSSVGTDTSGAGVLGTQSPFSSVASGSNSVPLIPSGTNPVYDSQGNLVAFQSPATPPATVSIPPPATTPPVAKPTQPPAQPKINTNPLVPNSLKVWMGSGNVLYEGTSPTNQHPVNLPKNSGIRAGSNGRYWVFTPQGQQLITNNFGAKPV